MLDYQPRILDNGFIKMPYLSVSPIGVTLYNRILSVSGTPVGFVKNVLPIENKEKGKISKKGQRALKKAVYWFLYSVSPELVTYSRGKNKVSFLTLTLPSMQKHSDKDIKKKCLNQFLTEIRESYGVTKYIWKAEKQDNYNLHFHILTNTFLPVKEVKEIWNRVIDKLGYVREYSNKMKAISWPEYWELRKKEYNPKFESKKFFTNRIRKAYKTGQKTEWRQPNSIDIESLRGVKNIAAYISKYMTKGHKGENKDKMNVQGRIWYSSQAVSKMKNLQIEVYEDEIQEFTDMVTKYQPKDKIYESDYSLSVVVPVDFLKRAGYQIIPDLFFQYCKEIFAPIKQKLIAFEKVVNQDVRILKEQLKEIRKEFESKQLRIDFI